MAILILQKLGYRVDVVENGLEAVRAVSSTHYDLVLMDVQMPELDGLEATGIIRRTEAGGGRRIPIVAMTAHAMTGDREMCLEAGMDDYISKPIRPRDLSEIIERLFPEGSPAAGRESPPAPSPRKVAFDPGSLLEGLDGEVDLAKEVVSVFLEDIPTQIEKLKQAIEERDAEAVNRCGHKLKGAAGAIGAIAVRDLAAEIETAGKEKALDKLDSLMERLDKDLAALTSALYDPDLWS
jgi:CheY-like chemotaxis protein